MSQNFISLPRKYLYSLFLLFFFTLSLPLQSIEQTTTSNPVNIELLHDNKSIEPGSSFWVAIHMKLDDNWHCYWKNPGDVGMPISIEWDLPQGFEASAVEWPVPKRFDHDTIVGYGYENEVVLIAKISAPDNVSQTDEAKIGAKMSWLACSDSACLPGRADLSMTIPISKDPSEKHETWANVIEAAREQLPKPDKGALTALRNSDLLELVLEAPNAMHHNRKVLFFPETQNHIDDRAEATISMDDEKPGMYVVSLKEHSSQEQHLKGILVVQDETSHQIVEAIEVDLPIKDSVGSTSVGGELAQNDPITSKHASYNAVDPAEETTGGLLFFLLTAFAGGLILNLMPCVLPVISLKVMSFVQMSGQSRTKTLKHGLSFFFGVLVSFWALATMLLMLQLYGRAVGWGFQMQDPTFITVLAIVMLIFGLSMFGVMEVGTLFASWAGQSEVKVKGGGETLYGSFFSGVLATAVATPCTGPLLGPALGFAVTQPPLLALLIFTSLGTGMAAPYLLLSAFPSLLKFVPKPGNWMITFKQFTGFIMLACVIWFLWIFSMQTSDDALFTLVVSLFLISLGCWVYGKWASPIRKRAVRIAGLVAGFGIIMMGSYSAYIASSMEAEAHVADTKNTSSSVGSWEPYDEERLAQLRKDGVPVLIDFTARWCLTCQANHLVLSTNSVEEKLNEKGVVKMKADWTKYDPVITKALSKFGRNSVPLYLLYSDETEPEVLPQILKPGIIIDALDTIEEPSAQDNRSS